MDKIDALFYVTFYDSHIQYIPESLENLEEEWGADDILILFNISVKELGKIKTLLGKYCIEVK